MVPFLSTWHICQPNDVGPFKPLKNEWRKAVSDWRLTHPFSTISDPVQPQIAVTTSPAPAGDPVQPQIAVFTSPVPAGDPVQPQIAVTTTPAPAGDPVQPLIVVSTSPAAAGDPVQPQIAGPLV